MPRFDWSLTVAVQATCLFDRPLTPLCARRPCTLGMPHPHAIGCSLQRVFFWLIDVGKCWRSGTAGGGRPGGRLLPRKNMWHSHAQTEHDGRRLYKNGRGPAASKLVGMGGGHELRVRGLAAAALGTTERPCAARVVVEPAKCGWAAETWVAVHVNGKEARQGGWVQLLRALLHCCCAAAVVLLTGWGRIIHQGGCGSEAHGGLLVTLPAGWPAQRLNSVLLPGAVCGRVAENRGRGSGREPTSSRVLVPPPRQLLLPGGLQDVLGGVPHSQLQGARGR